MGTKAFTGDISGGRLSFIKRSDMYGENKKIGTRKCDIRLCGIDRSHQLSAFPRAWVLQAKILLSHCLSY